jgi:Zn-dependent M28 family amino/carboxypeptidase
MPIGRMRLVVNLDMVARSKRHEIFAAGTSHHPTLRPVLDDVRRRAPVSLLFGHDRSEDGPDDWTHDSDHWPFHKAGVPFLYFGVEDHDDYHRPTDTAERIDVAFFGDVANTIVEALIALDGRLDE